MANQRRRRDENGETKAPRWLVLGTYFIGWGVGGFLIVWSAMHNLTNPLPWGIGVYLLMLPLAATKPTEALPELVRLIFGGRK